jgi:hypothetical protein
MVCSVLFSASYISYSRFALLLHGSPLRPSTAVTALQVMLAQQQQTCLGGAMHISLPLHPHLLCHLQIPAWLGGSLFPFVTITKARRNVRQEQKKSTKGTNGLIFVLPPTAFILYRQHYQSAIINQNPGLANPEISKIIGAQWREENIDVKNEWKRLAEVRTPHFRVSCTFRRDDAMPGFGLMRM